MPAAATIFAENCGRNRFRHRKLDCNLTDLHFSMIRAGPLPLPSREHDAPLYRTRQVQSLSSLAERSRLLRANHTTRVWLP
jgi:hypothetical protein